MSEVRNPASELALLDEVSIPSARGGRKPSASGPLEFEIVRSLGEEDLPDLLAPAPLPAGAAKSVLQIRHAHHSLARLLAAGHAQEEVALITGYSTSYISVIKDDPAFAELLGYYATQRDLVFIDVIERMRVLGLNTLEELQQRIAEKPGDWSNREMMELAELLLVKSRQQPAGAGGGTAGGSPVNINIEFVQAGSARGTVIDAGDGNGQ